MNCEPNIITDDFWHEEYDKKCVLLHEARRVQNVERNRANKNATRIIELKEENEKLQSELDEMKRRCDYNAKLCAQVKRERNALQVRLDKLCGDYQLDINDCMDKRRGSDE